MKVFMFVIMFLLVGAFFIISNEELPLDSSENIDLFFEKYGDWADGLFSNGRTVIGYVAKMEWLPNEGLVEGSE